MGVQFAPILGYQQIRAGEVWELFRPDYPEVQEQPMLPPAFETFGLPSMGIHPSFRFLTGAPGCRFWFKRSDGAELIQFQEDRLIHNWRKVGSGTNQYPRYEAMVSRFDAELCAIQQYFQNQFKQELNVNQCEISYINHIPFPFDGSARLSDWLRFLSLPEGDTADFTTVFREVIRDESGTPQGRLICEANTAVLEDGRTVVSLTLTVRGVSSKSPTISSALEFLGRGRELIVRKFAQVTTDEAHKAWGRVK